MKRSYPSDIEILIWIPFCFVFFGVACFFSAFFLFTLELNPGVFIIVVMVIYFLPTMLIAIPRKYKKTKSSQTVGTKIKLFCFTVFSRILIYYIAISSFLLVGFLFLAALESEWSAVLFPLTLLVQSVGFFIYLKTKSRQLVKHINREEDLCLEEHHFLGFPKPVFCAFDTIHRKFAICNYVTNDYDILDFSCITECTIFSEETTRKKVPHYTLILKTIDPRHSNINSYMGANFTGEYAAKKWFARLSAMINNEIIEDNSDGKMMKNCFLVVAAVFAVFAAIWAGFSIMDLLRKLP